MNRPNKLLNLIIVAIAITLIGCSCRSQKSGVIKKETDMLSFVDWSNGLPSTGQWREGIAFYDINGDGHLDIAAPGPRKAQKGDDTPFFWYGNGKGEWSESRPEVPSEMGFYYGGIAVADFDGDGLTDMALAMHGSGIKVLKGKAKGEYVDFSDGIPSKKEFMSRAIVSADFNNDSIPDIAAVSEAKFGEEFPVPSGVRICYLENSKWKCNPIGGETETLGLFADQLTVGDINGDGNKDIVVASLEHMRDLIVWIGDGKGAFVPFNGGLPTECHYLSVALADINGDGRDDLAASIGTLPGLGKEFLGLKAFLSGPDAFKDISDGLPTNEGFTSVRACDLNGDGRVEIVAATGEGGIKIFSQKGARWHEMRISGLPEKGLRKIKNLYCIDVNGDGRMDIALNHSLGQNNSGGIRVFLNVP